MSSYRHVIWDWNGTLLDDAWLCVEIMNQLLDRYHLPPMTPRRYQEVFGFPLRDYCERLGFDFEAVSFEQLTDEFIEAYERRRVECGLQGDAAAVLAAIGEAGLQQSILSAYSHASLEEVVGHFQLGRFFVGLNGVDNHYGEGKVAAGQRWLARLPDSSRPVVLVGDTLHDSEVAQVLAIDCILVPSGHQHLARLRASRARIAESLAEVLEVVCNVADWRPT